MGQETDINADYGMSPAIIWSWSHNSDNTQDPPLILAVLQQHLCRGITVMWIINYVA
jgi:hypothetical protein